MPVSRLAHIPGIGVDEIGDAADAAGNPDLLRLENLDTDVPPPPIAREITHIAVDDDAANSYWMVGTYLTATAGWQPLILSHS